MFVFGLVFVQVFLDITIRHNTWDAGRQLAETTYAIFSTCDCPENLRSRISTGFAGRDGRLFHTASIKLSWTPTNSTWSFKSDRHFLIWSMVMRVGSKPTRDFSGSSSKKVSTVGVSGNPDFIRVQLESNCWLACKKYRPSVHKAALSVVTTANPVTYSDTWTILCFSTTNQQIPWIQKWTHVVHRTQQYIPTTLGYGKSTVKRRNQSEPDAHLPMEPNTRADCTLKEADEGLAIGEWSKWQLQKPFFSPACSAFRMIDSGR